MKLTARSHHTLSYTDEHPKKPQLCLPKSDKDPHNLTETEVGWNTICCLSDQTMSVVFYSNALVMLIYELSISTELSKSSMTPTQSSFQ